MPQYTTTTVEVEFTAGVWTNISDYVESDVVIDRNRRSAFSPVDAARCTFTLNNSDGRFTGKRQVLADGTTAHPYWPNVVPRKRVRVTTAATGTRFVGRVKDWPVEYRNKGAHNRVQITATDDLDRVSRVRLENAVAQSALSDGATYWWPLADEAGAVAAVPRIEATQQSLAVVQVGSGGAATFGESAPVGVGLTGLQLTRVDASNGKALVAQIPTLSTPFTAEVWFKVDAIDTSNDQHILTLWQDATAAVLMGMMVRKQTTWNGEFWVACPGGSNVTGPSVTPGTWNHGALSFSSGGVVTGYLNGVNLGTIADAAVSFSHVLVGSRFISSTTTVFGGGISNVAIYPSVLSDAQILTHYEAGGAFITETTGERVDRFLSYAGITTGLDTDATGLQLNTYPQGGKSVLDACRDQCTTEGGGSVFWVKPNGDIRFTWSGWRFTQSLLATFDAAADLDNPDEWAGLFNDDELANDVTGNRADITGTVSSFNITDAASVTAYQRSTDTFDSYVSTDAYVIANAQDRLSRRANPGFRVPKVVVDLTSAQTNHFTAVTSLQIGNLIRVSNIPAGGLPATQIDLAVEGWREILPVGMQGKYLIEFDTSPVTNIGPAGLIADRARYDTARYQCDGNTLNASLTSSATTVVIATAGGKATFTTVSARYPMTIQVDEEQITLGSAPGGATSPQTFTGCTRGVNGTPAAAHASAAAVNLAPANTYAL